MKLITAIEKQGKGRMQVFADGELAFVLYRTELARLSLREGMELDEELIHEIEDTILIPRALKRLLYLLGAKDYTRHELREKLCAGQYTPRVIDIALERLAAYGYVDDADYASRYLACYMGRKSKAEICRKLLSKGLSRDLIDRAMREYLNDHPGEGDSERELIAQLLSRRHFCAATADPKERQRAYAYLARHGFRSADIVAALNLSFP